MTGNFDLCGPLPEGVTVLEASAGTGKTFTIAALTARYVAEGAPLDSLLLVTFTRIATGELRERVRERLVSAERELARALAGAGVDENDEIARLLADTDRDTLVLRRNRLADAVAGFDAATIETTHGFCQKVLDELGTLGDLEPDTVFVEDVEELEEEVIDDLYLRRFHRSDRPELTREEAGTIARMAIRNPDAVLHPLDGSAESLAAMRRRLAEAARRELTARKRQLALLTYDDQLTRLRDTLAGPRGPEAATRLRSRYQVVLIDEFQDTDPIQWEIVHRAFGSGVTLVLIADPKQAIYAFRGADVYAYLAAAREATHQATLPINRRSDQPLLDGFDALFEPVCLGHPDIPYRQVRAAPCHRHPRLHDAPDPAALRFRVVDRDDPAVTRTTKGFAEARSVRELIARDVAAEVVALLASPARIDRRAESGETIGSDPIRPADLAVLVRRHTEAALVQAELTAAAVPAVINGAGSVFATPAGQDWLTLLEALERPTSPLRARAAALTPFLGWDAERVACATEEELEELHQRLHGWGRILRSRGVAALTETVMLAERIPGRVLARRGGERRLTDLGHVSQILHAAAAAEGLGTSSLTGWLRERIAAAGREGADELTRRLESDAEAVQVVTIHSSKGLEFPVVFCPFLWDVVWRPPGNRPVTFHDSDHGDIRALDVGLQGGSYRAHKDQHLAEERGEDLRLAYVALTRARHQATVWWAGSWNAGNSPLGRLLFAPRSDGNVPLAGPETPADQTALARFGEIRSRATSSVSVGWARLGKPAAWSPGLPPAEAMSVARFDRRLDLAWRRTSYSAITAAAHEAWVGSEPEEAWVQDEPSGPAGGGAVVPELTGPERVELTAHPLPLAEMAMGPDIGTLVHRVLEAVDFTSAELGAELAASLSGRGLRTGPELGCEPAVAAAGLAAALQTPLQEALGGATLTQVPRADRLDELGFELPLAGGDEPRGRVGLGSVADLLRRWLPDEDPLAGYADQLEDPVLESTLRGYLTGSIDLVVRLAGADGPRFALFDYKTNWLAPAGEPLSAWHYRPSALQDEMQHAHYGLQALLYTVALHRYLRWRLPGYDPSRNLAGAHYLFVRGMLGPGAPAVESGTLGVFSWHPPAGLVVALSDVLEGV
ncbi:MAG TPA: UvrD-helicase domain-containing protein [Solirubrobacteraceae bacterium]|nr:UvrD-helicase domain-containing protein [Solirubrobacteraceae bacterium]